METKNISDEAHKNFTEVVRRLANDAPDRDLKFDLEVNKKLLSIFQVGDYYYFIFNLKSGQFDILSPEVEHLLGYPPSELSLQRFMGLIHPEDISWFVNFENKVVEFFSQLRPDRITKYKVSYDYRVRKADGTYIRILHQAVTIQYDEQHGGILRTLGIHTDITTMKKNGIPLLSFIGLDDEPSYIDVDVAQIFLPKPAIISRRETEVLQLLIEGRKSREIADVLFISLETVNEHRKNMLRKTGANSTPELVAIAVKKGWI